jgi:hypothetical protein
MTLLICPVVVGQGTQLFPDTGPDTALDLVESRSTPSGVRARHEITYACSVPVWR